MNQKIIEFISYDKGSEKFYPPIPAKQLLPEWYKNLPIEMDLCPGYVEEKGIGTIKKCIPVLDYLTGGYVIINPYEVKIEVKYDNNFKTIEALCPAKDYISAHPNHQCPIKMHGENYHYIKFVQPWLVKTPPGYSCMFYQPYFWFNEYLDIFPGVVDTDKHPDSVNLVGIAKKSFTLKPGDPLAIVYPFKRNDWKMEYRYEDYTNMSRYKLFIKTLWNGAYAKLFHSKKKFT